MPKGRGTGSVSFLPFWPQGRVSPGPLLRQTPCPPSPPPGGGDTADPLVPHNCSAVSTLSDICRKISACKKLWITGSSVKEGRRDEGLGAALLGAASLGLWDMSQGGGEVETPPSSSVSGSRGSSLPPGRLRALTVTELFLALTQGESLHRGAGSLLLLFHPQHMGGYVCFIERYDLVLKV